MIFIYMYKGNEGTCKWNMLSKGCYTYDKTLNMEYFIQSVCTFIPKTKIFYYKSNHVIECSLVLSKVTKSRIPVLSMQLRIVNL